jgi:hypothetical protein
MANDPFGLDRLSAFTIPAELLKPPSIPTPKSPAQWAYERLGKMVKRFEAELDAEHEIGVGLVSFGTATEFHIEYIGYWGPDIITFDGLNAKGERVQLIQNVSQLSLLLVAMKKLGDQARRIGFLWDEGEAQVSSKGSQP